MSCHDYLAAVPFPAVVIVGVCCFVAGYLTAALSHKVKETRMTPNETPKWRGFYDRIAPLLLAFCAFSVIFANIGVFWLNAKRGEDQQVRTADNTAFIKCIDTYTTDLSGSLPPVREASAHRDKALSKALGDQGLKGALAKIAAQDFDAADLKKLIAALSAYADADRELTEARRANPYPSPPSKFCDLP